MAQHYWLAGLRATHTADDAALGAYIIYGLAQQATEQGRPAEAATLVETALIGARGRATPALLARLHISQAYARAVLQDGSGCTGALAKADSWAERVKPEKEPSRLYWVNQAEVTADIGWVLLRLGRADQAVRPLADGVRQLDDSIVRDRQLFLTDWATRWLGRDRSRTWRRLPAEGWRPLSWPKVYPQRVVRSGFVTSASR